MEKEFVELYKKIITDDKKSKAVEPLIVNKVIPGLQLEHWINNILQTLPNLKEASMKDVYANL